MTERNAFLNAILSNPADDTVRLVYADWLDENGESDRAEFIRWHLGLLPKAARPFSVSPSLEWVDPLPRHTRREKVDGVEYLDGDGRTISLTFRRGFAESVTCSAEDWLAHADYLFWSPQQTVECGECIPAEEVFAGADPGDTFTVAVGANNNYVRCRNCAGTGRAPRPLVPTAHPITRVTLTTMLANHLLMRSWPARWPGIEFVLPG